MVLAAQILLRLNVQRAFVADFYHAAAHVRLGLALICLHKEPVGKFSLTIRDKSVIVFINYADIRVVVPWNIAPVPHRAKQSAVFEPVADIVATAESVYLDKDVKHAELQFPDVSDIRCHH